jgi:hypothetical protein
LTFLAALLPVAHLVGLALAMGSATVKLVLLIRTTRDQSLIAAFARVSRPITHLLVAGMLILLGSGLGWLFLGYPLDGYLVVKLVLVAAIFVLGPVIDRLLEPAFHRLAPSPGQTPSEEFLRARRWFLGVEALATLFFYAITVFWMVR